MQKQYEIAFGTYRLPANETKELVEFAINAGIRRIDTAQLYCNEIETYEACKDKDVYLTTKIHKKLIRNAIKDNRAIENSLMIKPTAVLLHCPEKNFEVAWEQLKRLDVIRGVSNFNVEQLQRLSSLPAVNQIEVTPFNLCPLTVEYCKKNGIQIEAHSALIKGRSSVSPRKLLGWSVSCGFIPIFSSKNKEHILENLNIEFSEIGIYEPIKTHGYCID